MNKTPIQSVKWLVALSVLLCATVSCLAQQAPPITTSQLTIPANAVSPSPPATVNVTRIGTPGPNLYYYWVVADLPIGWSTPSAAALVSSSNGTLDTNNYNRVTWSIVTGATSYQVLRTTTSTQPAPGCTCATTGGTVTATSFNDQSNTLGVYSNSPWSGDTSFNVTNKVVGAGESQLTFAADHGSVFAIDSITGAVLPAPTLNNATLTGTTTVKGPFQASGGGEFAGTWPNAGTIAGGAVNPQSLDGVQYADQFSGADIGAQVNAAYAAGSAVVIPPGIYTFSTPITLPAASGCSLAGAGSGLNGNYVSILKYTGTGSAISQFTTNQNAGGCQLSGFVLDGSADTNTNVSGINFGGSNNFTVINVVAQHFNQSGDAGIKLENKSGRFTERYWLSPVTLFDDTTGILMAVDSGGGTSFEHGRYINGTFSSDTAAGQTWISVTGGGSLSASTLVLNGNCGGANIGCTAFSVDGTSSITDDSVSFLPECDASGSGTCTIFNDPTGGNVALISPGPFNAGGWTLKSGSGTISLDGWIGGSFSGVVGNTVPLWFQNSSAANDAQIFESLGGALNLVDGAGNPAVCLDENDLTHELCTAVGVEVGSPTGGAKGVGTINVQNGLYVNGTALIGSGGGFSFAAGAVLPSGQTLTATGATINGGTVNAGALEQGSQAVALKGVNGISAGTVTLVAGAGSHTFTTAYASAPVCTASDTTAPNAVQVTSSTTAVTLAGTTTDVVAWQCSAAVN